MQNFLYAFDRKDLMNRFMTTLVWILVFVVLIIGIDKLFHIRGRSTDQQILMQKAK